MYILKCIHTQNSKMTDFTTQLVQLTEVIDKKLTCMKSQDQAVDSLIEQAGEDRDKQLLRNAKEKSTATEKDLLNAISNPMTMFAFLQDIISIEKDKKTFRGIGPNSNIPEPQPILD